MAGRPASPLNAEPDRTLHFTPHPEYWITAGTFTEGEVINPQTVSNPLRLHFGTKAVITVTLHQGGAGPFHDAPGSPRPPGPLPGLPYCPLTRPGRTCVPSC